MRRLLYSLGQLISSFRKGLSAPPVVAIPVPLVAGLALRCLGSPALKQVGSKKLTGGVDRVKVRYDMLKKDMLA